MSLSRRRYRISGIVQGVGFRPWLHRTAESLCLTGFARNTASGLETELQGEPEQLDRFEALLRLPDELPPLALIDSAEGEELPAVPEDAFRILPSVDGENATLIAPDIAICSDCARELRTPSDRRYGYPFINCTNCGPRFTIVKKVPYDRAHTSMGRFPMCPECAEEYGDIRSRRYHAQPDCCSVCGPALRFLDPDGTERGEDPIESAAALLRSGGILAVKGLGGYHLACLTDTETAERLRLRKHRYGKPLAVMAKDVRTAERYCEVSGEEKALLAGPRAPIVLLRMKQPEAFRQLTFTDRLGVMLPYTPLHLLLFEQGGFDLLVMTSANVSEKPVIISEEEALCELSGIADGFLTHNREILRRCDDTVLQCVGGGPYFYRRSRGYVPQPIRLPFPADGIAALGAEQKASFALGRGENAFYSQHIGDLKNAETLEFYERQRKDFAELFSVRPKLLVCDLHPDYLSSRAAKNTAEREGLPLLRVQHHHAHMCSCMADNDLTGECIGLCWDGTGLGTDGTVWGAETLTGGYGGFERIASIRPIPLIGGDAAAEEIGRISAALRADAGLPAAEGENPAFRVLLEKKISCPVSSGMGRLFDGVYALITGVDRIGYDGEAPARLEALAAHCEGACEPYEVPLVPDGSGVLRWDWRPMIRSICSDAESKVPPERIAMRFHRTVIRFGISACREARRKTGRNRAVLSGGSFFNGILLDGLCAGLAAEGFEVYHHHRVSTGDEGIAFGQLAIAAFARQTEEIRNVSCGTAEAGER